MVSSWWGELLNMMMVICNFILMTKMIMMVVSSLPLFPLLVTSWGRITLPLSVVISAPAARGPQGGGVYRVSPHQSHPVPILGPQSKEYLLPAQMVEREAGTAGNWR